MSSNSLLYEQNDSESYDAQCQRVLELVNKIVCGESNEEILHVIKLKLIAIGIDHNCELEDMKRQLKNREEEIAYMEEMFRELSVAYNQLMTKYESNN
jgi:hypothetical protein